MREPFHSIRIKRKTVFYFVAILLALAGVTPALADYLGPNRTVTQTTSVCKVVLYKCQYVASKGDYRYHKVNDWACSNTDKPWQAYPSQPPRDCYAGTVGDEYWEREDSPQETTNTYPPATISSVLDNCTLNNGWCVTAPQLSLSGYEPVAGYSIIAIEGSLNGQTFACQNASCVVPLGEGDNSFAYWALSSFGDSSLMDTTSAKVDSQLPNITGALSGVSGLNGWYTSPINFNGSASDATSGLASFTCTLDGNPLGSCNSITVNGEGAHTLVLNARDNAGNMRTLTQDASLDTQNPTLSANLSGTLGANNWYTAAVLNAAASDPTPGSGLSTFEYSLDEGNWTNFPASGTLSISDGKHTVNVRAIDDAGRTTSSSKSFWLDTVAPSVVVDPNGTPGANNWYVSNLNVEASASDGTSGIDIFEYTLDNNSWTTYTAPLTLADGSHNLSLWAQDQAGLVTQVDRNYQVDTRPPQIGGNISGITGTNGWYTSDVTVSASASDPLPGSGIDAFTYILNNGAATLYTNPLSLSDGQHTIQFHAQDQAGLTDSLEQHLKVDTIHPALAISTTLPNWVKDEVSLGGTVADNGSGLSKLQISIDGGQTWQALTGATPWNYDWKTTSNSDGSYNVHVRATDNAGLTTEKTLAVGLDNHAPKISLPDSWFQWDTVTLDVWDNYSGLADTRVEISDPDGRWRKRVIELDTDEFPLSLKWDRRFGDGTVAPLGTYDVIVIARDRLGNTSRQSASIKILLDILPPGPTTTPQPSSRDDTTPTPAFTTTPISSPTATQTPVISVFGNIDPTAQVTPIPAVSPTPRATPTQTGILDWWESIFVPDANAAEQVTEITSPDLDSAESRSESNVLWGAAAAAMVGSVTAYALEERRRQEEAKAYQAALEAEAEEHREKMQARKIEKMDAQRAQEAAWEQARIEQERFKAYQEQLEARMERREAADDVKWMASQEVIRQRAEEQNKAEEEKRKSDELKDGLAAYYNATKQGQAATAQLEEKSWWEKATNFVQEKIVQPATNVVEEIKSSVTAKNIAVTVLTATLGVQGVQWASNVINNSDIFAPAKDHTQALIDQYHAKYPLDPTENHTFSYLIQHPYEVVTKGADVLDTLTSIGASYADAIWQQNPLVQASTNALESMEESVCTNIQSQSWANRCTAVFYVPAGMINTPFDTTLGVANSLVVDPVTGIVKQGALIVDAVEEVASAYQEGGLGAVKDTAVEVFQRDRELIFHDKQLQSALFFEILGVLGLVAAPAAIAAVFGMTLKGLWDLGATVANAKDKKSVIGIATSHDVRTLVASSALVLTMMTVGLGKQLSEFQTFRENLSPSAQASLKNLSLLEQTRLVDVAGKMKLSPKAIDFYLTESARPGSSLAGLPLQDALRISSLTDTFGEEMLTRFLPFCEDYGINPYDALRRPPTEGQSLIGWTLGIEDPKNPVNHPLMKLNLTEAELTTILTKSTVNPDSKVVVLGYGNGVAKPYFILGKEVHGSYLSLPSDAWAPFDSARANFWADINAPYIKMAIQNRKIFLFNVSKKVIEDPRNAERFSLPELRLIEMKRNNYTAVRVGDYTAYVPLELLDSYQQYLPQSLLQGLGD